MNSNGAYSLSDKIEGGASNQATNPSQQHSTTEKRAYL